jgi:hypothetical protein
MRIPTSACLLGVLGSAGLQFIAFAQDNPSPDQPGVEVLARGPVHEAYVEPSDPHPHASPLVPPPCASPVRPGTSLSRRTS